MEKLTRHHLAFERPQWRKNQWHHKLRCHQGMIIPIPMESIHRPLHRTLPTQVPLPDIEATKYLVTDVIDPYNHTQDLFKTVDQVIGWYAMTNNEPTAEHLHTQKEFIQERLGELWVRRSGLEIDSGTY